MSQDIAQQLKAIGFVGVKKGLVIVKYQCYCGTVFQAPKTVVENGKTKSCGCTRTAWQQSGEARRVHGQSNSAEYLAWQNAKARCFNPNTPNYHRDGGRGITVCQEWVESFSTFLADMGYRPSNEHSLERKNNNEGYNKNNCKWATAAEQAANKEYT